MAQTGASHDIYRMVLTARLRAPAEPLFSRHAPVWLHVWAATQLVALITATRIAVLRHGSLQAVFGGEAGARLLSVLGVTIVVHIAGVILYRWLVRESWRCIVYVAVCWALVFVASWQQREYSLLALGALFQACIFLPFQWITGALTAFVIADVVAVSRTDNGFVVTRFINAIPILVLGVIVGAIVLYIHRSNRDAAVQEDLLRKLDAAQQDLAARSREAGVLAERQRLSRDLHDTLAQGFTSVIAQLSAAELVLRGSANDPDASASAIETIGNPHIDQAALAAPYLAQAQAVSRASLTEIRRLVLALRPSALAHGSLSAALDRVVNEWAALHGVRASFESSSVPELVQDAEVTFLRATQEGLSNVARHASARNVSVRLSHVDDLVLLEIDDDGVGISEQTLHADHGLGIAGMRERAAALGGRVIVESNGGNGTSLTVALPLATAVAPSQRQELA
ncbi:MAG TPA: sensor histidine kinase [Gemmatimonadaceae bacterium]|nr:sensor histidine kinase [Gemmatimonadaceae bacterium]